MNLFEQPQQEKQPVWQKKAWEEPLDFHIVTQNQERKESCLAYFDLIKRVVSDKENWIGEGGAARVFRIGESGLCVKVVKNRHEGRYATLYNLGNTVQTESAFMRALASFEVDGVRTPEPVEYLTGKESGAIVMEELDAVDMQRVILGENLPDTFDFESFFDHLETYIDEMHAEKGICHKDLYPKNIMIDRKMGLPRVIDFGRSIWTTKLSSRERRAAEDKDWEQFEKTKENMRKFLTK